MKVTDETAGPRRVVVTALIHRPRRKIDGFRPADEFLIMRRPPDAKFWPNVWAAPGGGLNDVDFVGDPTETAQRALLRELDEETGGAIEVWRPYLLGHRGFIRSDGTGVFVLTFMCQWVSGEPVPTEEAAEWVWVTATEAITGGYDLIGDTGQEIMDASNRLEPF